MCTDRKILPTEKPSPAKNCTKFPKALMEVSGATQRNSFYALQKHFMSIGEHAVCVHRSFGGRRLAGVIFSRRVVERKDQNPHAFIVDRTCLKLPITYSTASRQVK